MSDMLVEIGKNRTARTVIGKLGLPIPLPQVLNRGDGPWSDRPLVDRPVIVGGSGELAGVLSRTLARAGADLVLSDEALRPAYAEAAEAWSRPLGTPTEGLRPHALVFDASGMSAISDLRGLYDFFHPLVRSIGRCGRVIVLGRPPAEADSPSAAAAHQALEGFVRSVAKEVGRKGATANLLWVAGGAEAAAEPVLRWLLSDRSAFVTGQPFTAGTEVAAPDPVPWTRPLDGKVALVTGAAQGIGADIARRLAAEGAKVVGLDRPQEDARLADVMVGIGGLPLLADLADPEAPALIADTVQRVHGGIDIVVHNAGITRDKTLGRMDEARWDLTLDVNLEAVLRVHEALAAGPLRDDGRVVLLASIAGIAGNVGQTNYACSKSGVIGLARALAPELAPRGITVNAVAPGFIETRLTAAIPLATREPARRLSSLGQGGQPVDVAELITFLSTPGAASLTGQVHRCCGQHLTGA